MSVDFIYWVHFHDNSKTGFILYLGKVIFGKCAWMGLAPVTSFFWLSDYIVPVLQMNLITTPISNWIFTF